MPSTVNRNLNIQIIFLLLTFSQISIAQEGTCPPKKKHLILNGTDIDHHDLGRYVVSLQLVQDDYKFGYNHLCGGTIIGRKKILTAAHCCLIRGRRLKSNELKVVVGLRNRFVRDKWTRVMDVQRLVMHPDFRKTFLYNDIGLIYLKENIPMDNPSRIDIMGLADTYPMSKTRCTVAGWGHLYQVRGVLILIFYLFKRIL